MGKSLSCTARFAEFTTTFSSQKPPRAKRKPTSTSRVFVREKGRAARGVRVDPDRVKMESDPGRVPLAQVVADCVKQWFQDTLKEAKDGDVGMQVLVAQMYCSGYGVPKDEQKGRAWINRASRTRSSASQVSDKHPGYNASDSDSDELK